MIGQITWLHTNYRHLDHFLPFLGHSGPQIPNFRAPFFGHFFPTKYRHVFEEAISFDSMLSLAPNAKIWNLSPRLLVLPQLQQLSKPRYLPTPSFAFPWQPPPSPTGWVASSRYRPSVIISGKSSPSSSIPPSPFPTSTYCQMFLLYTKSKHDKLIWDITLPSFKSLGNS